MNKYAIQVLQSIEEDQLINQACLVEFQKGVSQAALMRKYGIGRDRLYKAIHGKIHPGGTQYQTQKREQPTTKEEAPVETMVKAEPRASIPSTRGRGRSRGRSSQK